MSGNIPVKTSHGIIFAQLIRFSRVCQEKTDFIKVSSELVKKLISQDFKPDLLRKNISKFFDREKERIVKKYKITKKSMIEQMLPPTLTK